MQAQEPASPYIALWNRVSGFQPHDLDAAFASQAVVKATLMRITLHAVVLDDHDRFLDAMQPTLRAARLNDRRFRRSGLSPDDADALLPEVLAFASQARGNAEVEAWLDEHIGVSPKPGVWWALRQYGPFVHAPTGGPWSFGTRPAYVAAPTDGRGRRGSPAVAGAALPVRLRTGVGARRRPVRHGPAVTGPPRPGGDGVRARRARGPRRRHPLRPAGRPTAAGRHASATAPAADVGQRVAGARRSQSGDRAGAPAARDAPQRRRAAHGAGRRLRRRRLASGRRRDRGDRVRGAARRGLGRHRARGTQPAQPAGRPRSRHLPPLRPVVGEPAADDVRIVGGDRSFRAHLGRSGS